MGRHTFSKITGWTEMQPTVINGKLLDRTQVQCYVETLEAPLASWTTHQEPNYSWDLVPFTSWILKQLFLAVFWSLSSLEQLDKKTKRHIKMFKENTAHSGWMLLGFRELCYEMWIVYQQIIEQIFFFWLCAYPFWIGNNELKTKEHASGNLEN